jgi:hypothetical protein
MMGKMDKLSMAGTGKIRKNQLIRNILRKHFKQYSNKSSSNLIKETTMS